MKFELPFELLPCPKTIGELTKMTHLKRALILEQNQLIAQIQFEQAGTYMRLAGANDANEDAYAFMWKFRRDTLIDIVGDRIQYSWRKRDIAHRELALMGVNLEFMTKDKIDV